jgi:hypothetical protein
LFADIGVKYRPLLNRKLVLASVFIATPFLFLWDFLLYDRVFYYYDFEVQWVPFHQFAHAALMKGQSLLWNPFIMLGFPQHAESQIGAFYPINLLLHFLPNQDYAISLSIYLHLIIGLVSTYFLGRAFKLSAIPAIHAAFCFGFSGFIFAQLTNYNIALAAAYLPLKLLLITWYFDRNRAIYLLYFALASAAELLISHANMSFITSVAAGLYFLILVCARGKIVWRDMGLYILFSVSALLLAAIQIFPTLEFVTQSERAAGVSYEMATGYSHSFSQYLTAFFPLMFSAGSIDYNGGSLEEFHFFIGSFGILLAVFGILNFLKLRDNRFIAAIGIAGLCALILSLGENIPLVDLYRWLIKIPGFSLFRCPARWSLVLALALAIFSGYGLQILSKYLHSEKRIRATRQIIAIALIMPLILYGLGYLDDDTDRSLLPEKIMSPLQADLSHLTWSDQYLYGVFTYLDPLAYFLLVTLILALIALSTYKLPVKYCTLLIATLGLLDILLVNKPFNTSMPSSFFNEKPYYISNLQQYAGIYRTLPGEDVPNTMSVNNSMGAFYGIQSTEGYASMKLNNYLMLKEHLHRRDIQDYVGTRYEIVPNWDDGFEIDERMDYYPRAFLLDKYIVNEDETTAFNAFLGLSDESRKSYAMISRESAESLGLLENSGMAEDSARPVQIKPASITSYQHTRIEIHGRTDRPAFLVLTDMFYPDWQARVNGELTRVIPLNGVFRGVYIEKTGPFSLEFEYRPLSFRAGAWLSLLTLLLIAVCAVVMIRRHRPSVKSTSDIASGLS